MHTIQISLNNNLKYEIKLPVTGYSSNEVKLKVEKNILNIIGERTEKNKQGYDYQKFLRQVTLPDDVKIDSMKHHILKKNLIVEFQKIPIIIRPKIENISNIKSYIVKFDVKDLKKEDVSVNLSGRQLVIEGQMKNKSSNIIKEFQKVVLMPTNVDCSTVKTIWNNDDYLNVEANYYTEPKNKLIKIEILKK